MVATDNTSDTPTMVMEEGDSLVVLHGQPFDGSGTARCVVVVPGAAIDGMGEVSRTVFAGKC